MQTSNKESNYQITLNNNQLTQNDHLNINEINNTQIHYAITTTVLYLKRSKQNKKHMIKHEQATQIQTK